jgi:hypothetical protein
MIDLESIIYCIGLKRFFVFSLSLPPSLSLSLSLSLILLLFILPVNIFSSQIILSKYSSISALSSIFSSSYLCTYLTTTYLLMKMTKNLMRNREEKIKLKKKRKLYLAFVDLVGWLYFIVILFCFI